MKVAVLSGGVGGARFVCGLADALPPEDVTVIANVGDDLEVLGLSVSPACGPAPSASAKVPPLARSTVALLKPRSLTAKSAMVAAVSSSR